MTRPMTYFYTPEEPSYSTTDIPPLFIDKAKDGTSARKQVIVKARPQSGDKITYGSELHRIRIHSKNPFF